MATVEQGSLSGAARVLKQTQPTVSRQITALEQSLQLTLLERGTRVTALTEAGRALLAHAHEMAESAARISRVAIGQAEAVAGSVKISASDAMITYSVAPCVASLRAEHPGIEVELVPSAGITDLTRREADIAIRHVRPTQADLIAKRLPDMELGLFASKAYLEQLGRVDNPADLASANFVGYETADRLVPQMKLMGLPVSSDNFTILTTSGCTLYELVREGAGIALLPTSVARGRLGLVRILPEVSGGEMPTWLVTHRELNTSPRIRLTFDHLAENLAEQKWSKLAARH
ncbi:HTH-type transcriptional regulator CatM [Altererythrobacter insulae]|nr:HTH-type transcriptional regulator CatM [Altererythrobacter insulae]